MTLLFISWVCDDCSKALGSPPFPEPSRPLVAGKATHLTRDSIEGGPVASDKPAGHPTGFEALDALTGTGGYPISAITELFGDDATLDRCWNKLPCLLPLDLDWRTEDLLVQVSLMQATCPMIAIKVYGGDGRRYADLAAGLFDLVVGSGSGIVLFNAAVRTNPRCSVAPQIVKVSTALRVRLMGGIATVVKSRWGDTGIWCSL